MTIATPPTYYPGMTVRVTLTDLTHISDGTVTSADDASVSFEVQDLAGTVDYTGAGTAVGDDWHLDFPAPSTPGAYKVVASVVYNTNVLLTKVTRFDVIAP